MGSFTNTLLITLALALACALLSVVVVLCRWAFIGEGISHSGFGGAGTAWLLMLIFPSLDTPAVTYGSVILFCLLTAIAIGILSRSHGLHADAAIGIFMVASLAWGFLCQQIYSHAHHGAIPTLFENLLFGELVGFSNAHTLAAVLTCLAVCLILIALWKEILAFAFDPLLAASSGVRARFIHFLLVILAALVIVIGMRVVGSVLVTALLILPAATALRVSWRLTHVVTISIGVAVVGCLGGLLISRQWPFLPAGPVMVLLMFLMFLVSLAWRARPMQIAA